MRRSVTCIECHVLCAQPSCSLSASDLVKLLDNIVMTSDGSRLNTQRGEHLLLLTSQGTRMTHLVSEISILAAFVQRRCLPSVRAAKAKDEENKWHKQTFDRKVVACSCV